MKKYLIKIAYKNDNFSIVTTKAKNQNDLELKIAKDLKDIFGSLDDVKCIEYEQIKSYFFKGVHHFVGCTLVGGKLLEKMLKENEL